MERNLRIFSAAIGVALLATVATASAAPQTTTTEMKKFEVLAVDGNRVVLKGETGKTAEYTLPDDFRFNIEGRQISVADLKPGMKGVATITTTTTMHPVYVTEVKQGKVLKVVGNSVLVATATGNKMFTQGDVDKRGVTIMKEGRKVDVQELREGDALSATLITEGPPTVMTQRQVEATLHGAPPPPPPTKAAPAMAEQPPTPKAKPAPAAAAAGAPPMNPSAAAAAPAEPKAGAGAHLPSTAGPMPIALATGGAALVLGGVLTLLRRRKMQS